MQKYIKVPLTQNQHDALVSFFYNVGSQGFYNIDKKTGKPTTQTQILQKLNRGDYLGAANEFDNWRKGGGRVLQALVDRRANEKALFLS